MIRVKVFFVCIVWVVVLWDINGQTEITTAEFAGIGFASVSLSSVDNPAGVSLMAYSHISAHYDNLYGIKELSQVAIHAALQNRWVDAGLVVSEFGFDKYSEGRVSAQFSKKLSKDLSLGIRMNGYWFVFDPNGGMKKVISSDLGVLISPLEKLQVGINLENLISSSVDEIGGGNRLPFLLRMGGNYTVSDDCILLAEVVKDVDTQVRVKLGCAYHPLREVVFRIGMVGRPYQPTFGLGYRFGRCLFDLASVYHTVLGFHSLFSMKYKL